MRDHFFLMTRQNLLEFAGRFWFIHCNSPDIATSDFHLLQSLQNSLRGKKKKKHIPERLHKVPEIVLRSKGKIFWEDRIKKLPEKLQKVMEQNMKMLSNKVLVKMKKYVFIFILKLKDLFSQSNNNVKVKSGRPGRKIYYIQNKEWSKMVIGICHTLHLLVPLFCSHFLFCLSGNPPHPTLK